MGKARIIITGHGPSYEVWVEQDGRRFLFAIAGSLEDAGEEAREAGERIRDKAWPGGKMTPTPLQLATNRQRAGAPSPTTAPPLRKWKGPPGRDTGRPLVRLPAPGLLRFRRDNLMLRRFGSSPRPRSEPGPYSKGGVPHIGTILILVRGPPIPIKFGFRMAASVGDEGSPKEMAPARGEYRGPVWYRTDICARRL
jgi:hypothetical protein